MSSALPRRHFLLTLLLLLLMAVPATALARKGRPAHTIATIEALGVVSFPTGFTVGGTEMGGLSGLTYDRARGVYYALSDDRSQLAPARYYTLDIDFSDGRLDSGDVTFLDVTFLRDENGALYPPLSLDPEGLALARPGQLFVSSEGDAGATPPQDPFVNRYSPEGELQRALPVPDKFLPAAGGAFGIRNNLAFESLTVTPDRTRLVTATEAALAQDGPPATLGAGSPARVLVYTMKGLKPEAEYVYEVDPIAEPPSPPGAFAVNGLVEMLALDDAGTFLAMERSFSVGAGNTVVLYEADTGRASDVSALPSLMGAAYLPMNKRFLADFESDFGIVPDNLEALAFGPPLPDGRTSVIVASDNNFSPFQTTQFILLGVELDPASRETATRPSASQEVCDGPCRDDDPGP